MPTNFLWQDLFKRNGPDHQRLLNVLKDNILFSTLGPSELRYLSTLVYERVYQPNEAIFNQNDRGLGVYMIAKGRVAIKSSTPDGEVLVATLNEGSFFGEIALVDQDNLRTASAISMDRCTIVGFFKPDLMELLERKPSMGVKILFQLSSVLAKRLLETTERMAQINRSPMRRSDRLEKVV